MIRYKEIEFKYLARHLSISDFLKFGKKALRMSGPNLTVSGADTFYANEKYPDRFLRHRSQRIGKNELTLKIKTDETSNTVRVEHNIELAPRVSGEDVAAICASLGYQYNTILYKKVFAFVKEKYTLVYYTCYNKRGLELDSFIEIEMSESYPWKSSGQALKELCILEKRFSGLGICKKKRLKKSLWELYRAVV